jgi:hypothetical protein
MDIAYRNWIEALFWYLTYLCSDVEPCEVFNNPCSPNTKRNIFSEQDAPNSKSPNQEDWDEGYDRVKANLSNQWEGEFHPGALILKKYYNQKRLNLLYPLQLIQFDVVYTFTYTTKWLILQQFTFVKVSVRENSTFVITITIKVTVAVAHISKLANLYYLISNIRN